MSGRAIAVIDYESGNLQSVLNAFIEVGAAPDIVSSPIGLDKYDKIVLPGVGAFGAGMRAIRSLGLIEPLNEHVAGGKPLLGICLGMQLLCSESTEYGHHEGLGWIDAKVVAFPDLPNLKVPHVGWNDLQFVREDPILKNVRSGDDVYFNHSFMVQCEDDNVCLAKTTHGVEFASMLIRDNIVGMQFHPEKSQMVGIELLRNFVGFVSD